MNHDNNVFFDKIKQPFVKFYNAKNRILRKYPKYRRFKKNKQSGGVHTYPKKVKIKAGSQKYKFVYENDNDVHFYMLYDNKDNE